MPLDLRRVGDIGPARAGAVNPHDHFVEIYESDPAMVESVVRFVRLGVESGEAAMVVAEKPHIEGIERGLRELGIDPRILEARGLYLPFDSKETLDLFMVDGVPDANRFERSVGAAVARAGQGGRGVRVFGEMVAVMWREGDVSGALQLEDMWNDLATRMNFKLFCAYPAEGFGDSNLEPLRAVCHRHSHVIAESPSL